MTAESPKLRYRLVPHRQLRISQRFSAGSSELRLSLVAMAAFGLMLPAGCGSNAQNQSADEAANSQLSDPPIPMAPSRAKAGEITVAALRAKLKAKNPQFTGKADILKAGGKIRRVDLFKSGVGDISPLAGLPLRELILEDTKVSDISVLKGMPLKVLKIQNTGVSDITPLQGMTLNQLNLMGTKVTDISVVSKMPLKTLWISSTSIDDLSPLEGKSLESLDVQDAPVTDLSVLNGMSTLKRLNIAGSKVTDLTPLEGLQLERLIFTPKLINRGIDIVKEMPSLDKIGIGTSFNTVMRPADFWEKFEAGELP